LKKFGLDDIFSVKIICRASFAPNIIYIKRIRT